MPTFCKCDSLNSSFCKRGLVVFIHPQAHLIFNELLLMTFQTLLFCFCIFFIFFCLWCSELQNVIWCFNIAVIIEDGFIFGYLILYLIFSLSFVKCAMWEYMALDVWKIQYVSKWLFCWGGLIMSEFGVGGCRRLLQTDFCVRLLFMPRNSL